MRKRRWQRKIERRLWAISMASRACPTIVLSISCFFANTKNFSYPWSPYIFEYMMTANHTLFEKEGVFGFHVSTCHLEQLVAVAEDMFTLYSTDRSIAVHVHVVYVPHAIHVGRGFIITSLFGAYLLTTYTYKRIRLLTGVYGMFVICFIIVVCIFLIRSLWKCLMTCLM